MTRAPLIVSILLASGTAFAQAPAAGDASSRPRFGIVAGLNLATIDYDGEAAEDAEEFIETRTGFAVGGAAVIGVGHNVALRTGLRLSQKGADYDLSDLGIVDDAWVELTYLEIPALISFQIPTAGAAQPFVGAGAVASFLLSAKTQFDGESEDIEDDLSSTDLGLAVVAGVDFPLGGLTSGTVEVHYTYGLVNIDDTPEDDVSVKNRVFSILGGILF